MDKIWVITALISPDSGQLRPLQVIAGGIFVGEGWALRRLTFV